MRFVGCWLLVGIGRDPGSSQAGLDTVYTSIQVYALIQVYTLGNADPGPLTGVCPCATFSGERGHTWAWSASGEVHRGIPAVTPILPPA